MYDDRNPTIVSAREEGEKKEIKGKRPKSAELNIFIYPPHSYVYIEKEREREVVKERGESLTDGRETGQENCGNAEPPLQEELSPHVSRSNRIAVTNPSFHVDPFPFFFFFSRCCCLFFFSRACSFSLLLYCLNAQSFIYSFNNDYVRFTSFTETTPSFLSCGYRALTCTMRGLSSTLSKDAPVVSLVARETRPRH